MEKIKNTGCGWVYDHHFGGIKIPPKSYDEIIRRINAHVKNMAPEIIVDVKFRSQFCYVGTKEDNRVMPVCRIRYFGRLETLSYAFYTYSNEKYQSSWLSDGKETGTLEAILDSCGVYLS